MMNTPPADQPVRPGKTAGAPYRWYARALYRLFSAGLSLLSPIRPLFRLVLRVLTGRGRKIKGRVLPVNASLGEAVQASLSRDVLEEMIRRSTAVAAMGECLCRAVGGCKDYPVDIGCLVLGDAVQALHPGLGRAVNREEALALADRALALGLVPMVLQFSLDAALWTLAPGRMLTVCFCCPCHCLVRKAAERPSRSGDSQLAGLPGLALHFDGEKCTGCGRCAAACFAGALTTRHGKPVIGSGCLCCGRCAMACAHGALVVAAGGKPDVAVMIEEYQSRTEEKSVFL